MLHISDVVNKMCGEGDEMFDISTDKNIKSFNFKSVNIFKIQIFYQFKPTDKNINEVSKSCCI